MQNQDQNTQTSSFRISNIELIKTEIYVQKSVPDDYKCTISLNTNIDTEAGLIACNVTTLFHGKELEEKYAEIVTRVSFLVKNIAPAIIKNPDNTVNVDTNLLLTVISISISTTRGIVYSSLRNTTVNNAIMPLFDAKKIIENTVVGELKSVKEKDRG
jgi:hypothetical protein